MTVVRGLLMKEEEPDKWAVLERMMDHNEERRAEEDEDGTFAMYKENVVQFLRVRCGLADRFSEDEVKQTLTDKMNSTVGFISSPSIAQGCRAGISMEL